MFYKLLCVVAGESVSVLCPVHLGESQEMTSCVSWFEFQVKSSCSSTFYHGTAEAAQGELSG